MSFVEELIKLKVIRKTNELSRWLFEVRGLTVLTLVVLVLYAFDYQKITYIYRIIALAFFIIHIFNWAVLFRDYRNEDIPAIQKRVKPLAIRLAINNIIQLIICFNLIPLTLRNALSGLL